MSDSIFIKPTIDDLFTGKTYDVTPEGTHVMALAGLPKIQKTAKGDLKLQVFFVHTEEGKRGVYNGVNGFVMLGGVDKDGKSLRRQFAQLLYALGVPKEDIFDEEGVMRDLTTANPLEDIDAADWKGVPAQIVINGIEENLKGRKANVLVKQNERSGKMTAASFYPAQEVAITE